MPGAGDLDFMIGVGIAFIVVGIVFLFVIPWVGIPVGIVGLFLALLWVAGFGRRTVGRDRTVGRNRV